MVWICLSLACVCCAKKIMNPENNKISGKQMHLWACDLFPICRSITGQGVRDTLKYLKELLPGLLIKEVPSGKKAFDWTVPDEWNIRDAFIEDKEGKRIIDYRNHNLHIMGYSESVDEWLKLEELDRHLYSIPDQPDAIPYVTSYYERRWGFCLTHNQRNSLKDECYRVVVDSDIKPGVMNYAELIIPGESKQEVLLSTYICHPSMANNELSGPVVTTALAQWVSSLDKRRYTYRIIFIPETIGSIVYLKKNLSHLKQYVIAGFNITCLGDERCYSFLPTRNGNTLSDRVALHVLKHIDPDFIHYTWLDRGSDERQYCSPGVDLPIATIMRSKYGEYPEYHTSLDNLDFITPDGLKGSYQALEATIKCVEQNKIPRPTTFCEIQLEKRGLYPHRGCKDASKEVRNILNLISYSDGENNLLDIAELIGLPFWEVCSIYERLLQKKSIK